MLTFFRKIREKLLTENRFNKYLLYASGEIILVVIGILIALQINNWNQNRNENRKEVNYLSSLQNDLIEQLNYIQIQKSFEQSYIDAAKPILLYFKEHNSFEFDQTFFENSTILNSRKTFIVTDPTFMDLVSSGNINLIRNDVLRKQVISYYQYVKLIEKIIQNNNTLIIDQQYANTMHQYSYYHYPNDDGYLFNFKNLDSSIVKTRDQIVYNLNSANTAKALLQEPKNKLQFMNVLNHRYVVALGHYQRVLILEEKTKEIMTAIDKELKIKPRNDD